MLRTYILNYVLFNNYYNQHIPKDIFYKTLDNIYILF